MLSSSVIVRVSVVLERTLAVGIDWRFDNLSGRHLQSQVSYQSPVDTYRFTSLVIDHELLGQSLVGV